MQPTQPITAPRTDACTPAGDILEDAMDQGAIDFAKWFSRTMDGNGWSHPNLVNLCKSATGDKAWLHSSQIAGLRKSTLKSPGPRSFVALEYLWRLIDAFQKDRDSVSSAFAANYELIEDAIVMRDEEGNPATTGYMIEVFAGIRPVPIELSSLAVSTDQAKVISVNLGRTLRRMMTNKGWDLVDDVMNVTRHFSSNDGEKALLVGVIHATLILTPEEVDSQAPNFSRVMRKCFEYHREPAELIEEMQKNP